MELVLVDRGAGHETYEIHNPNAQLGMPYQVAWISKHYCTLSNPLNGRSSVDIGHSDIRMTDSYVWIDVPKERTLADVESDIVAAHVKFWGGGSLWSGKDTADCTSLAKEYQRMKGKQ